MEGDKTKVNEDKTYIKSSMKWRDFPIHQDIVQALLDDNKSHPTRVQAESLEITVNPDRKKFNLLIRSANGSGKTMAFLIPILNCIEAGLKTAQDKTINGKVKINELFKPQAIIIVQTNTLQMQIRQILKIYQTYGVQSEKAKLKFTIGRADGEQHLAGDILVAMPKSLMKRIQRKNMDFSNCKFVAIDEVDEIFDQDKEVLTFILKALESSRPSTITCSATMKKQFISFYEEHMKDLIKLNINEIVQKQVGGRITLEGVKSYYKVLQETVQMHKFVISTIFKHLYDKVKVKPQIIIFFPSIEEINGFHEYFKARASDFTSDESQYLQPLSVDVIAANKFSDGKKEKMTMDEKEKVMKKFRNNQINIILATNIIARGIDVRNACFVINLGPPKVNNQSNDIDLDIYLHRVGRTGRHNDKGLALTLINKDCVDNLINGMKKIHKIEVNEMKNAQQIAKEVFQCIEFNAQLTPTSTQQKKL